MRRTVPDLGVLAIAACVAAIWIGCGANGDDTGEPDGGTGGVGGTAGSAGSGGLGGAGGMGGSGTGGTGGTGATGLFHPPGFEDSDVHGLSLRQGELDCRLCHGMDLTGSDREPSCDICHTPADPRAWRTDCVFCHGGVENPSGAPPKNLDGTLTSQGASFPAHDVHVTSVMTAALDCVECHVQPNDVLSMAHVFDDSAGVAEVDLGGGRSPGGEYDSVTGCSSLYCHGTGRGDDGSVSMSSPPMSCASCHADANSSSSDLATMSGLHSFHILIGAGCQDCHQATTADGATITTPALHINGQRDSAFSAPGFTYDRAEQSCNGTCHGYPHVSRSWIDSGAGFHPAGFADPGVHGPEMELQRTDCRSCHGVDLSGGAGPSCDSCHSVGWRSDCVFCHGGDLNLTGAPPRDLGALPMSGSQAFSAHTAHVIEGISRAYDCVECHRQPSDVLSTEHAFDDTPGSAEVDFMRGLSAAATYDGAGGCRNLYCHGNGRGDNGSAIDGSQPMACDSCHPGMDSELEWDTMSGEHSEHLGEGVHCGNCHFDVTENGRSIRTPLLHVDGASQVRLSGTGITYSPATGRCSGQCHGELHDSVGW